MVTRKRLKELLNYDSETGEFTRVSNGETVGREYQGRVSKYTRIYVDGI